MKNNYKLVALDLDGTLLNDEGVIGNEDKKYLMELSEKGIHVVLISGRPTAGVKYLVEELNLHTKDSVFGSFNGGKVSSTKEMDKAYFSKKITREEIQGVRKLGQECGFVTVNYTDEYYFVDDMESIYAGTEKLYSKMDYIHQEELPEGFEDNKCLVVGHEDEVAKHIEKYVSKFTNLNVSTSKPFFIEITPKNVNKGTGLSEVSKILGIDASEMIAFGDGWNDKEMLDYVGHGVVMANASQDLKDSCDNINNYSNNDNGISKYIKEVLCAD